MEDWVRSAIDQWKQQVVKLNPPAIISSIEEVELALNFEFSKDFKQLYLNVDGFADLYWLPNMFTIRPLQLILDDYSNENNEFIGFADFLLNSHEIGFLKGKDGVFKNYGKYGDIVMIAQKVKEVIELINADDRIIY